MNENVKLRKGLFGFSSKSVNEYVISMNNKFQEKLDDKDDLIDDLKKEIEELKLKNKEMEVRIEASENKHSYVGEALVKAQEKAEEIIEDATKDAINRKNHLEEEIKEASMKLKKMNEEIKQLKESVENSMTKYQSELNTIIKYADKNY